MTPPSSQHQRSNHRRTSLPLFIFHAWIVSLHDVRDVAATTAAGSTPRTLRSRQYSRSRGRPCFNRGKSPRCPGFFVPPCQATRTQHSRAPIVIALARNRNRNRDYDDDDDDDDWDDYFDDDEDDDDDYYRRGDGRRRAPRRPRKDDLGTPPLTGSSPDDTSLSIPSPFGRGESTGLRLPASVSAALLAGVFVLGIGTGVTVDSQINTNPKDLASRDAVDKNAPNPTLCTTYGASAMAFDQRVFVSFNPFNVYVAQADVKPACVLRQSNVVPILKERKLINDKEVRSCKLNDNTWAWIGDLNDEPQLSCVYRSEDAQNEFLEDPKRGIGEDYLDDDRAKAKVSTKKSIKGTLTEGQKKLVSDQLASGT